MFKYIGLALSVLLVSCHDDQVDNVTDNPVENVMPSEEKDELNRPTPEMIENIESQLSGHFESLSKGDYEHYVEYVYPGSFENDEVKAQVIEEMKAYEEQGWHNITKEFQVEYISPLVEDSIGQVAVVDIYMESAIVIDESFPQKPELFENMIKSKYGRENVIFDAENRTYYINGNTIMYAITPKDSIHFTFLSSTYVQSPSLARLMPFNTVRQLKIYEKERP